MNNLVTRTITGVIFISAVIGALLFSADYFAVLLGIFSFFGLREITKLLRTHTPYPLSSIYIIVFGMLLYGVISLVAAGMLQPAWSGSLFFVAAFGLVISLLSFVNTPLESTALSWFSVAYIVVPLLLLMLLRYEMAAGKEILGMFVVIWGNDTMAYVCGRLFGKTKLTERISPKKTWEGTIGGVFFSLTFGILWSIFVSDLSLDFWVFVSPVIALSAIFGDLFESAIKRQLGVKDSGNLLPGHGGLLDRFDATFMAAPVFYGAYYIYTHLA